MLPPPVTHYEHNKACPKLQPCSFPIWISLSDIVRARFANSSCINTQGRASTYPHFKYKCSWVPCCSNSILKNKSRFVCFLKEAPARPSLLTADRAAVCPSLINKISILPAGTQPAHTSSVYVDNNISEWTVQRGYNSIKYRTRLNGEHKRWFHL